MGVNKGHPSKEGRQKRLVKNRRNPLYAAATFPDIETPHPHLQSAVTGAKSGATRAGQPLAVVVDVFGHLGYLRHSLPGDIYERRVKAAFWKPNGTFDLQSVLADASGEYSKAFSRHLQDLDDSLRKGQRAVLSGQDKLIYFVDNSLQTTGAKLREALLRKAKDDKGRQLFDAATKELVSLHAQQLPQSATKAERNKRASRVKHLLKHVRQNAATRAPLTIIPPRDARIVNENPLGLQATPPTPLQRKDVADAYAATNPDLVSVAAMQQPVYVKCLDEADISIYRWAAVASASHTVVVLSGDSDFNYIPRPEEVRYTIGYRRREEKHILTNNTSFHEFHIDRPWTSPKEARMTALLVGHDYWPTGLSGLGMKRLIADKALVRGASWSMTRARLITLAGRQGAPRIWKLAQEQLDDHREQLQHALDVMNLYYHPPERHATAEQLAREPLPEIEIPAEGTAPTPDPRLSLRFPGHRKEPRPVVAMNSKDEVDAASRSASRRPARCKNLTLHSGRNAHAAFSAAHMEHLEAPLLDLRRPHHRPPYDPAIDGFASANDHPARRERQSLFAGMGGHANTAPASAGATAAGPQAAAAAGQQAAAAAQGEEDAAPAQEEEEEEEEAVEPPSSSEFSGGMYEVHTSKVRLRKAMRAFKPHHLGANNPLEPLVKLVVLGKREMIAVLNAAARCYARELCLPDASDIGKVRFCASVQQAQDPLRQLVQLFFAPPPLSAEPVMRVTLDDLINDWVAQFTPVDGSSAECRLRISRYIEQHPISPTVLERYLIRVRGGVMNPDHADPCLLQIASRFLGDHLSLYPDLPGEKDKWVNEMMRIGVHQKRMRSQAALKQWLKSELKRRCGADLCDPALQLLWDAEHHAIVDVSWASQVHGQLGTTAENDSSLHEFLLLFRDRHHFLPLRGDHQSLARLFARPSQSYGQLVPFFGMLGRDFSVNIRPLFVHFNFKHTYNLLNNCKAIVIRLLEWLNGRPALSRRHPRAATASNRRAGVLEQSRRAFVKISGLWVARSDWLAEIEHLGQDILRRAGATNGTNIFCRIPLMDVLFDDRCLRSGHIWQGTWHTDGVTVGLGMLDVRTITLPEEGGAPGKPNVRDRVQRGNPASSTVPNPTPLESRTISHMFLSAVAAGVDSSFCRIDAIKKRTLGYSYRRSADPKKKFGIRTLIHNTYDRLERPRRPAAPKNNVSQERYKAEAKRAARRENFPHFGTRTVLIATKSSRKQKNGLPASVLHVSRDRPAILEEMKRLVDTYHHKIAAVQGAAPAAPNVPEAASDTDMPAASTSTPASAPLPTAAASTSAPPHQTPAVPQPAPPQTHAAPSPPLFSTDRPRELIEQFIRFGLDEGVAFVACVAKQDSQLDQSAGLALCSKGLDAIRREGNTRQSGLENSFSCDFKQLWAEMKEAQDAIDALEGQANNAADRQRTTLSARVLESQAMDEGKRRLLQSDHQYGLNKFTAYRARSSIFSRFAQQLAEFLWTDLKGPLRPVFGALGDGCGFGHDGRKNRNPPFAKPLIKYVMDWMKGRGYPFFVAWTDEAFSSQCCPDPLCRRPPGANDDDGSWREELRQAGPCTIENLAQRLHWIRSRMFKPYRNGSNTPVYRILQCETCFRTWNRDISASFCIVQIAEHQLVHNGLHPFRRTDEEVNAGNGEENAVAAAAVGLDTEAEYYSRES